MEGINETFLVNYPNPITIDSTRKILKQMENCICKINNYNGKGTGFFCYIFDKKNKNKIPVLITNNHVINEKIIQENDNILVSLNDEQDKKININLNYNRKIYTSDQDKYDTTIIEIKPEKDKLNVDNFLELDENILESNQNLINENIYIIQYPKYNFNFQKASVSYGILRDISKKYELMHSCSTELCSSGSPILNISHHKVIGIHTKGLMHNFNFNLGTLLKYPIQEYLNNINIIKKTNIIDDIKKAQIPKTFNKIDEIIEINETEVYGCLNEDSTFFDDYKFCEKENIFKYKLSKIKFFLGNKDGKEIIMGFQTFFTDKNGKEYSNIEEKDKNGKEIKVKSLEIPSNDFIYKFFIRTDNEKISQISLFTIKGKKVIVGDEKGSLKINMINYDANIVLGFYGYYKKYLEAIGFLYIPNKYMNNFFHK